MSRRSESCEPATADALAAALARLDAGTTYKTALEELLLALDEDRANRLQLLLKEGRGAWLPLLRAGGGEALFVGNALSGTAVALARSGFCVTVRDASELRVRFAAHRDRALARGELVTRPHAGTFDLVVHEEGSIELDELRRAARGELVWIAENRLAYKRSTGLRGDFRVQRPGAFARAALRPSEPRRTLFGYRRALAATGFARPRALALYPHARDFAQVVALDDETPRLSIGPKERANRLKLFGYRAGLFPLLTPSFALIAAREEASLPVARRLERVLAGLAERVGEPLPVAEHLVATRGNTAVVHTALVGGDARDPLGRWTVHVPLSPQQREQAERHFARLGEVRRVFPAVPVPEPLFAGELEGLFLTCERRLGGLTAPQLAGEHAAIAQVYRDVAEQLATLVRERVRVDEALFDELVGAKVRLVARHAGRAETAARVERMGAEARERMLGRELPRVLYHADLRSKHVQVTTEGRVLGYLDWGSSERSDLPYFDLLHLVVHERKQEAGLSAAEAWRIVRAGDELRPFERDALADYARRVDLDEVSCAALAELYPVLVGAMAESNWDYSRPRWLHRNFGV